MSFSLIFFGRILSETSNDSIMQYLIIFNDLQQVLQNQQLFYRLLSKDKQSKTTISLTNIFHQVPDRQTNQASYINLLMKILVFLVVLCGVVMADQFVPISKVPYGFTIGDPEGTLHIQAFYDFLCPDSKESYGIMRNVMKTVDFAAKGIKFTYQHIPLSYHFYAFKVHQAFVYVQKTASADTSKKLIDYFFDHQEQFFESVVAQYTISQFLDELSAIVASIAKVNQQDLRKELMNFSATHDTTRFHWKYSVEVHGVSGAPFYSANSVRIDGAEKFGYNDWIEFFTKYTS